MDSVKSSTNKKYREWIQITSLPSNVGYQSIDTDGDTVVATDWNGNAYYAIRTVNSTNTYSGIISYNNDIFTKPVWNKYNNIGVKALSVSNNSFITYDYNNSVYYSSSIQMTSLIDITTNTTKLRNISYDAISGIMCGIVANDSYNTLLMYRQSNNIWDKYPQGYTGYFILNTQNASVYNNNMYQISTLDNSLNYYNNITTNTSFYTNKISVTRPNNNTVNLIQIDFTDNLLVGIDSSNNVWSTYDVYKPNPYWFKIPNVSFRYISVSVNGIMGIDNNNNVYGLQYSINPLYINMDIYPYISIFYYPIPGSNIKTVTIDSKNILSPTIYTDCSLTGQSLSLDVGDYNYGDSRAIPNKFPNDSLSSLNIPQGYKVSLYSDYIGSSSATFDAINNDIIINCLTPNTTNNSPSIYNGVSFDNTTSSLKIENRQPSITYNNDNVNIVYNIMQTINDPVDINLNHYALYSNLGILNLKINKTYKLTFTITLDTGYITYYSINYKVPVYADKPTINNAFSTANGVNLNFAIPNNNGTNISSYIIRKYTDKNTCMYKILPYTDPSVYGKTAGQSVNYVYTNNKKQNFIGDTSNLTTNCVYESYKYIIPNTLNKYKKPEYLSHEPFMIMIKASNSVGDSEYSDSSNDIIPVNTSVDSTSNIDNTGLSPTTKTYIAAGTVATLLVGFGMYYYQTGLFAV